MVALVPGRRQKHGGRREIVEEGRKSLLIWPGLKLLLFSCFNILTSGTIIFRSSQVVFAAVSLPGWGHSHVSTHFSTSLVFYLLLKILQNSFLSSKTQKYFAWSLLLLFQTWRMLVFPKHCLFAFQLCYFVYKRCHLQALSWFKNICVFQCKLQLEAMFLPVTIYKIMEINRLLIVNKWCSKIYFVAVFDASAIS